MGDQTPHLGIGWKLLYFLLNLNGDGRSDVCFTAACAPEAGQESPASVVLITFSKILELNVFPVPEPSRIPAQASLIVLLSTVLLFPLGEEPGPGHSSSVCTPDCALPKIVFEFAVLPLLHKSIASKFWVPPIWLEVMEALSATP